MHGAIVHTNCVGHQEVTARRFYGLRASGSPEASTDTFKKLKVKTSEDQPPPFRFVGFMRKRSMSWPLSLERVYRLINLEIKPSMYSELRAPLIFTRWKLLRKFYEMESLSNKILFYRYDNSVSVITLLSFTIWLTIRLPNLDLELKLRCNRKYEY